MPKITFTKAKDFYIDPEYYPKASKKNLPDWYKNIESYLSEKPKGLVEGRAAGTIKKCIPVFDALTSGYIISTFQDIVVERDKEKTLMLVSPNDLPVFEAHAKEQFSNHPYALEGLPAPKFLNPWSIKTPNGYSCLFINPVHGANPYFSIFEGVVDTDKYRNLINFPFSLKDEKFEGLVPAGTPLVQVIPFKREKWKMKMGSEKELKETWQSAGKLKTVFYEGYKNFFWSNKSFE